ncbi:MAG: hypothetical protein GXP60_03685 [Epsilonproteobacteria bacterium]|nr:hypothetical protein [Campylobacterota bacterium]
MPIAVIYITALLFFIGAAPLPYGYYMLLRLIATGVFIWAAFVAYERKHESMPWVYGVLAILFNPLIKIHLPKELWAAVDIGSGILLLSTKSIIQKRENENT